MKKFLLKTSLAIAALLASITVSAHDFAVDGIYYNITSSTDKTVEVTYRGTSSNCYSGDVTIPSAVTYDGTTYSVTKIGYRAFYNSTGLTSVTIPNSVTSIGETTFWNCTSLTSATIPSSVTEIGSGTFSNTPWYNNQPDGVVYINNVLYSYKGTMPADTSIDIKEGIISISKDAFKRCTGLTSVTIPNSVTSIGNSAFYGCTGLTEVNIADLYAWCKINFGDCYAHPLYYASAGHLKLNGAEMTNLVIPDDITEVKDYTFWNCTGLTSVTIGNSVNSIGHDAFYNCTGLTSVTIGNSVTEIGSNAFSGCTGLTEVNITDLSAWCKIDFGSSFANPLCHAGHLKLNGTEITNLVIPDDITEIKADAFSGCTGLTAVTIPNSVTEIGSCAFYDCNGLTAVTIPNSVTEIGSCAFYDCNGLTAVTIPNSVTEIGRSAFSDCSGLTSVTIGNSVTTIGNSAFSGCTGLTAVTIPNSVTEIGSDAFSSCSGLTSVTIGNSVNSIGHDAFYNCTGLTSVTIGNSVNSIGHDAFYNCTGLTSVTIGNSVTEIGSSAFYRCTGLTEVNISDLSAWCKIDFGNSNANPLYYAGHLKLNGTEITNLVIPDDITEIKTNAFYGCTGLTAVTIPNSVTEIGSCAFYRCTGLTEVTIGNSVTTIGSSAFYDCNGLAEVTIGNSVTFVGNSAFYTCDNLTVIKSLNPEPPECYYNCFHPADIKNCTLEVPAGAKEAYASADYWSDFGNIVEINEDAIVEVFPQGDNVTFEISTIQGAATYTVNVYSDEAMTQLVATTNYDAAGNIIPMSTSLELSIDGFENGTYYYDVIAKSESGETLNNYTGSFEIVTSGISNVGSDDTATEVARYDIHGRLLSAPAKGINIVKYSDGTVKKIVIN